MSTTENNKEVSATFFEEVINQNQMDRANDLVLEDFVELDPLPGQRQGREGLKEVLGMMRAAFPDMHWVVEETVAEGDTVVSRFTWTGTHRGVFLGVPPTGKSVRVKGVVIDQLAGGKMSKSRILMDSLGMMQQLGVVPSRSCSSNRNLVREPSASTHDLSQELQIARSNYDAGGQEQGTGDRKADC